MKYLAAFFTILASFQLHGFERYDPLSFDYGFPPSATATAECSKIFGHFNFLAMRPVSEGQVFGTLYLEGEEGLDSIGDVKRIYFPTSYDFGLELLAGISLPGDQWAAGVSWFWYKSKQDASREDPGFGSSRRGGSYFLPGINGVARIDDLTFPISASGKWELNINKVDLFVGRDFLVGPAITLNPIFGLRFLTFKEKVGYESYVLSDPERKYLFSDLTGQFTAVGPFIGIDSFFELGYGFGGFVNTRLALLCAKQQQNQHLSAPFALLPLDLTDVGFKNDTIGLKGALDFAIGFEWRMAMNRDLNFFFVRVAFEDHLILRASEYPAIDSDSSYIPHFRQEPHDFALFGYSLTIGLTI